MHSVATVGTGKKKVDTYMKPIPISVGLIMGYEIGSVMGSVLGSVNWILNNYELSILKKIKDLLVEVSGQVSLSYLLLKFLKTRRLSTIPSWRSENNLSSL